MLPISRQLCPCAYGHIQDDNMILTQKQKILSWFDSYDIYDENDNIVYKVKGKLSWGHKLEIYDKNGNYLGKVVEKVITLLAKYEFFVGERSVGFLKKKLTILRPKFELECNNWKIDGNVWEWNYTVRSGGNIIMRCDKKIISLRDTYRMDITDEKDALLCLMIALSIDIGKENK